MILSLFRKDPRKNSAQALYSAALSQARLPVFYTDLGVDDSIEGRFELLVIHVFLVLRRLKGAGDAAERQAQLALDAFFANLDDELRAMGVGDLSVGRRIRGIAEAFYGRIGAYDASMAADAAPDMLESALSRNLYGVESSDHARDLACYMRAATKAISAQPLGRILGGVIAFPAPDRLEESRP